MPYFVMGRGDRREFGVPRFGFRDSDFVGTRYSVDYSTPEMMCWRCTACALLFYSALTVLFLVLGLPKGDQHDRGGVPEQR
jgi:hypothetical protein